MDRRAWQPTVQAITESDVLPPGAGEIFTRSKSTWALGQQEFYTVESKVRSFRIIKVEQYE